MPSGISNSDLVDLTRTTLQNLPDLEFEVALDFQGRLYDWPDDAEGEVEIHVAEGRHWLERDTNTYDVVQLSGVEVGQFVLELAKGRAGLNLVSDAMAALGMPPGRYQLNDFDVHVSKTDARLADGTLAGSILPLDEAVRNLIEYTGCSLSEALATVTTTPAALLGLSDQRGRIAPGLLADLVLLTPDLEVAMTISAGQITYKNQALETGI